MKILIIEDEVAALSRLSKLLNEIDPNIEIIDDLDSIESTVNWFQHNPMPDLLFFDIHLADGSSFEIFKYVDIDKPIIFTTAYDEYALDAFKVNAIDYLLKPIKKQDLEKAIEKYRQWTKPTTFDYQKLADVMSGNTSVKRFLIRIGQTLKVVDFMEVAYFYTSDKITFLVTMKGRRFPIDYSLEQLDEMADSRKFFRINRQFIINIEAVSDMYTYSKSRVKITLNPPCDMDTVVSTDRSPLFKKWLVGED